MQFAVIKTGGKQYIVRKGATVSATVLEDGRAAKKLVFRFKAKTRQKKKKGHRQPFTKVRIDAIATN